MTEFIEVAHLNDLPTGSMRAVTVGQEEVLLANVGGKIHAMNNRCGHMNAPLSEGVLQGNTVVCPFHSARFDVTTGQKTADAVIARPPGIEQAPAEMLPFLTKAGQMTAKIKTHDCSRYTVLIEGDLIKIRL